MRRDEKADLFGDSMLLPVMREDGIGECAGAPLALGPGDMDDVEPVKILRLYLMVSFPLSTSI